MMNKMMDKSHVSQLVRKKKRSASFFSACKEGFIISVVMIFFDVAPVTYVYLNADKLGFWWLVLLLVYNVILVVIIYHIYQYRSLMEIRGYFTEEEFAKKFPKDVKLMHFMDRMRKYFIN